MVKAVAGAGKTTLLVTVADYIKSKKGLYLAYNKSIATEAKRKFPKGVTCCTTHSLAYKPTVAENNLSVGFFSYRDIEEKIPYDYKCLLVNCIREFCLSSHTSFNDFILEQELDEDLIELGNKYLHLMQTGEISCTHDFYLKYFHLMLLHNQLHYDEFDIIMLDEAGDLNPVTLEIFKLLPSKKKVMVGDPYQNIYAFNHTINCFEVMKDKGTLLPMSQSFRVSQSIASRIQAFCKNFIDKDMKFTGIPDNPDKKHISAAYISRTNGSLIAKMMELNKHKIPYGLTRTAKQIFQLPLIMCSLKYKGLISVPEYKFLQEDVNRYFEDYDINSRYKNVISYIMAEHEEDISIQIVCGLIGRYGKRGILECYEEARKHEKANNSYILGTAHSTKGLEMDSVEIADDLNKAVLPIITSIQSKRRTKDLSKEELTELNLYYVACSRAKHELINARALDSLSIK